MYVLDASALLCLLNAEPGQEVVADALSESVMSAVNLSEVVAKLCDHGLSDADIRDALDGLSLDVRPFTSDQAYASGALRRLTRELGLSLGDRACLALAAELGAVALTADRQWVQIGEVQIKVVR
jgi:PIN domain nuclease of toxin-antitoxin system